MTKYDEIIGSLTEQHAELTALAARPGEVIDLSDAPEIRDWSSAVVGRFYCSAKQSVTLRFDADVVAWLRSHGPGYQARVNRLLRSIMECQRRQRRERTAMACLQSLKIMFRGRAVRENASAAVL